MDYRIEPYVLNRRYGASPVSNYGPSYGARPPYNNVYYSGRPVDPYALAYVPRRLYGGKRKTRKQRKQSKKGRKQSRRRKN